MKRDPYPDPNLDPYTNIIWAAQPLDKSGNFFISSNYHLVIEIWQERIAPLAELQMTFGGSIQGHVWICTNQIAHQACLKLLPLLKRKKPVVQVLIDFQSTCIGKRGRKISEQEFKVREQYRLKVRKMNRNL